MNESVLGSRRCAAQESRFRHDAMPFIVGGHGRMHHRFAHGMRRVWFVTLTSVVVRLFGAAEKRETAGHGWDHRVVAGNGFLAHQLVGDYKNA